MQQRRHFPLSVIWLSRCFPRKTLLQIITLVVATEKVCLLCPRVPWQHPGAGGFSFVHLQFGLPGYGGGGSQWQGLWAMVQVWCTFVVELCTTNSMQHQVLLPQWSLKNLIYD